MQDFDPTLPPPAGDPNDPRRRRQPTDGDSSLDFGPLLLPNDTSGGVLDALPLLNPAAHLGNFSAGVGRAVTGLFGGSGSGTSDDVAAGPLDVAGAALGQAAAMLGRALGDAAQGVTLGVGQAASAAGQLAPQGIGAAAQGVGETAGGLAASVPEALGSLATEALPGAANLLGEAAAALPVGEIVGGAAGAVGEVAAQVIGGIIEGLGDS